MVFQDLPDFIRTLERKKLLQRIDVEVNPNLEITEITDRIVKQGGPALYFSQVKDSPYPVLINTFGSEERMSLALGVKKLSDLGNNIKKELNLFLGNFPGSWVEKLKLLTKAAEAAKYNPVLIKAAPCQEKVDLEPDLKSLPILQCWPQDGGKFITLPLVFTKDLHTGQRNCGMYRLQVYDGKTTGMHWHCHKDGSRHYEKCQRKGTKMEVAVALGGDPATIYAATAPLPPFLDEMFFAGFLRKEPVKMVKCRTVDLEVPAYSEFVLEGFIDPNERRREGPFGDHTGYYSLADDYPVFHLTCLTSKNKPVYPTTVVGRPPMEDCFLGKATERLFLPLLQLILPELVDMNLPLEGVFHNCVIVSIDKSYPGQARKVMHAIWGLGQMMYTKLVIIVDGKVNVQDLSEVMWRVFNNIDARRDLVIVDGPLDVLDHASPFPCYGAKLGIDATKKWPGEGLQRQWPEELEMLPQIKNLVTKRWRDYGFS